MACKNGGCGCSDKPRQRHTWVLSGETPAGVLDRIEVTYLPKRPSLVFGEVVDAYGIKHQSDVCRWDDVMLRLDFGQASPNALHILRSALIVGGEEKPAPSSFLLTMLDGRMKPLEEWEMTDANIVTMAQPETVATKSTDDSLPLSLDIVLQFASCQVKFVII